MSWIAATPTNPLEPASTLMSEPVRILCFGNALHGDDGFGPAVAEALRAAPLPPGVQVVDCGIRGLDALGQFEDCEHVLVVDALRGPEAGRLYQLTPEDIAPETAACGHGQGVGALLQAVQALVPRPPAIRLLVSEVAALTPFQPGLSAPVAAAVHRATELIRQHWPREPRHGDH